MNDEQFLYTDVQWNIITYSNLFLQQNKVYIGNRYGIYYSICICVIFFVFF